MSVRKIAMAVLAIAMSQPAMKSHAQAIDRLTIRAMMTDWKQEIQRSGLTAAQRVESDRLAEARTAAQERKVEEWQKCSAAALTGEAMMAMGQELQQKMMSMASDPDMATKLAAFQQQQMKDLTMKKCGDQPKNTSEAARFYYSMRERVITYLKVRREKGAAAAAEAINATAEEAKVLEENLQELTDLAASEMKNGK